MQGTTWQNEFLVDTVLMSNDDQNPETGASDWIDDVVNRALKSSYGSKEETFAETEDQKETEDKQNLAKSRERFIMKPLKLLMKIKKLMRWQVNPNRMLFSPVHQLLMHSVKYMIQIIIF